MKRFIFFLNLFLFSFSTDAMDLSVSSSDEEGYYYFRQFGYLGPGLNEVLFSEDDNYYNPLKINLEQSSSEDSQEFFDGYYLPLDFSFLGDCKINEPSSLNDEFSLYVNDGSMTEELEVFYYKSNDDCYGLSNFKSEENSEDSQEFSDGYGPLLDDSFLNNGIRYVDRDESSIEENDDCYGLSNFKDISMLHAMEAQGCQIQEENNKYGSYLTKDEISNLLNEFGIRFSFLAKYNNPSKPNLSSANGNVRSRSAESRIKSQLGSPNNKSWAGAIKRRTCAVRDLLTQADEKKEIDCDGLNNLSQTLYRSGCWPLELTGDFLKTLLESWGDLTDESKTFARHLALNYRAYLLKSHQVDLLIPFCEILLDEHFVNVLSNCRSIDELIYKFTLFFLQKVIYATCGFKSKKKQKKNKRSLGSVDFLNKYYLSMWLSTDNEFNLVLQTFFEKLNYFKDDFEGHDYLYLLSNPFLVKILSVYDEPLISQGEVVELLYKELPYKFSTWEQLTTLLKQGDNYSGQELTSFYYLLKFYDLGGVEGENFLKRKLKEKEALLSRVEEAVNLIPEISNDNSVLLSKIKQEECFAINKIHSFIKRNDCKIVDYRKIINEKVQICINLKRKLEAEGLYKKFVNDFVKLLLKEKCGVLNKEIRKLKCFDIHFLANEIKDIKQEIIPSLYLENISGDIIKAKLALAFVLLKKKDDEHANDLACKLLQDVGRLDTCIVEGLENSEDKEVYVYKQLTNNADLFRVESFLILFNKSGECEVSLIRFNEVCNRLLEALKLNKKCFSFFELTFLNIFSGKSINTFRKALKKKKEKSIKKISFPEYSALCELKKYLFSQSFGVFMNYCLGG